MAAHFSQNGVLPTILDVGLVPSYEKIGKIHETQRQGPPKIQPLQLSDLTSAHPLQWSGTTLTEKDYVLHLTQDDTADIEAALDHFKQLGLDGQHISRHNFPLQTLGPKLEERALAIHQGIGFFCLHGIDQTKYSVEDNVSIYLGVSAYIADRRGVQNKKGSVLVHVTNSKQWTVPEVKRHGIHTNAAMPFHNDMGCDILALQVRHVAEDGGHTYLSSVRTVVKHLLTVQPEIVETLLEDDWPVQVSTSRHKKAPALANHNGRLMACLDPNRFGPHPSCAESNIPSLSLQQEHALALVSDAAQRSEVCLKHSNGDILFVNNWAILHRRDAYKDGNESSRHLVRLWLRNTKLGWPIPLSMLPPYTAAFRKHDDGQTKKKKRNYVVDPYPIVPMPDYEVPKYSAGSAAYIIDDDESSDSDYESGGSELGSDETLTV